MYRLLVLSLLVVCGGSAAHAQASDPAMRVLSIAAGEQHSVAVLADSSVWTWGLSGNGQLGREVTVEDYWLPRRVEGVRGSLAAAGGATSFVYDGGDRLGRPLWSTGYNHDGALGYGPTEDEHRFTSRAFPHLRALEAWGSNTLALLADSTLLTWGDGRGGQLGTGATPIRQVEPVAVPGLETVTAISMGSGFSLVRLADGTVRTWGLNNHGTLGVSGIPSLATTTTTTASPTGAVSSSASSAPVAMFSASPRIPDIDGVIAIAAGGKHALVVREDGTVWGWGSNRGGALGLADHAVHRLEPFQIEGLSDVVAVAAGDEFSLALKADGSVWMWGFINGAPGYAQPYERIRRVPNLPAIARVEAGHRHAFALGRDGSLYGWGLSDMGQVGSEQSGGGTDWPPIPVRFH